MSVAWDVFVLGLEGDRLEVERVGPSRTRAALLRSVVAEGFASDSHRQMLQDHGFEREAFRRPPTADFEQSAHMWAWFEEQVKLVQLSAELSRVKRVTERVVKATSSVKSATVRDSRKVAGFVPSERQLEIALAAQQAARGAVSDSAGRVASPTHTNTSPTLKPANGRTDSQTSSTNKWIPESTKREEAA